MFWGKATPEKGRESEYARHPEIVEMSKGEFYFSACMNIFRNIYGFIKATDSGLPIDKDGNPVPLYTYPAIEYLSQFDFSAKRIFEYGAGASTLFWMKRAREVVSVENNLQWMQRVRQDMASNVTLAFHEGEQFPKAINQYQGNFDIIVVDGAGFRFDCAVFASKKLSNDGMIILDNSDWHHQTAAFLREQDLIQIDMTGFKPGECHTSTTSLFLKRTFKPSLLTSRQPVFGMGAKALHSNDWDVPKVSK